jgi:hypothetical protein
MEIIERGGFRECREYSYDYEWNDCPGAGFGFPCDEHGNIDEESMAPEARENLRKCRNGENDVTDKGVQVREWRYRAPNIGRCDCGAEVVLDGFTNTCDGCGADYNSAGQRLAPRSQWGEETGESLGDILRIP